MATKRRVKRFVRDASRLSLSSLSLLLSLFSLHLSFPSASSVFFVSLCYESLLLQFEIYKRQRVFQGRASGSEDKDAPARMRV